MKAIIEKLYDKGYILNDGEIGYENFINGWAIQLYVSPEDETYEFEAEKDGEEKSGAYRNFQALMTAVNNATKY